MSARISTKEKIKFIKANMDMSVSVDDMGIGAQRVLVRRARDTFNYSPKTVDVDILMSLDKAWKEYQDGYKEKSSDEDSQ